MNGGILLSDLLFDRPCCRSSAAARPLVSCVIQDPVLVGDHDSMDDLAMSLSTEVLVTWTKVPRWRSNLVCWTPLS